MSLRVELHYIFKFLPLSVAVADRSCISTHIPPWSTRACTTTPTSPTKRFFAHKSTLPASSCLDRCMGNEGNTKSQAYARYRLCDFRQSQYPYRQPRISVDETQWQCAAAREQIANRKLCFLPLPGPSRLCILSGMFCKRTTSHTCVLMPSATDFRVARAMHFVDDERHYMDILRSKRDHRFSELIEYQTCLIAEAFREDIQAF